MNESIEPVCGGSDIIKRASPRLALFCYAGRYLYLCRTTLILEIAELFVIYITLVLGPEFFMPNRIRDSLGVLHLTLAHPDFFVDDGLLLHPDLLFAQRNTDLFLSSAYLTAGFPTLNGNSLDDQLLAADRHLEILVLSDDFLAKANLAPLHAILVNTQDFADELNIAFPLN
jgi:hypothetical protein